MLFQILVAAAAMSWCESRLRGAVIGSKVPMARKFPNLVVQVPNFFVLCKTKALEALPLNLSGLNLHNRSLNHHYFPLYERRKSSCT
jgi:hypothetical protein